MLFRKRIDKACTYCRYGAHLEDEKILCAKKGVKDAYDKCWKFKYDPCKRIPPKAKAVDFSKYEEADFSL